MNETRSRQAIVMACDEAYAMPLATTLRSIAESNRSGRMLDVFVLTSDFSSAAKIRVENSLPQGTVSIHWVEVDLGSFENFSTLPYISAMTYGRLLVSQVLPEDVTRVLYLDADILVLADLEPLWHLDLGHSALGAADDIDSQRHAGRLGLDAKYFNAGVLLIDLARWREKRIAEQAMEYLRQNPAAPLSDQDALNVVCQEKWKELDSSWNCQRHPITGFARVAQADRPFLIHYVGKWKPWDATVFRADAFFYERFRSRTQFARSSGERIRYTLRHGWTQTKFFLKQWKPVRLARACAGSFRTAQTSAVTRLGGARQGDVR